MKKLLILFILIGATAYGQWPQGKGHAYIKLGSWNQQSTSVYDIDGVSRDIRERSYFIPGVYARYGVTDKFTITGYLPYVETTDGLGLERNLGRSVGDATIAFEHLIASAKGQVFSGSITLGLPIGDASNPNVGTGDGELDVTARLLAGGGYKLFNHKFYAKANVGYTKRSKGYIDQIRSGLETGTTFGPIFILARLTSVKTVKTLTAESLAGTGGLFADFEKTTLGYEATFNINEHWGISAGHSHFLSGKLLFNAPAYTYGLIYKF